MKKCHIVRGLLLLLCFLLAGACPVWASNRSSQKNDLSLHSTINTPSPDSDLDISIEVGEQGILRSSNGVPISLHVTNGASAEFRGSLQLNMASMNGNTLSDAELHPLYHMLVQESNVFDGTNAVYHTSWQITIPSMDTVHITANTTIPAGGGTLEVQILDSKGKLCAEKTKFCSTKSLYDNYLFAAFFQEDDGIVDVKESMRILLQDQYYKLHMIHLTSEKLKNSLAKSNPEVVYVSKDYYENLAESDKTELLAWQQQGGLLWIEETITPEILRQSASQYSMIQRVYQNQSKDYLRYAGVMELEKPDARRSFSAFQVYGVLLLSGILAGPFLWYLLRLHRKNRFYWNLSAAVSLLFAVSFFVISLFHAEGAPTLLYLETLEQSGDVLKDDLLFGLKMPYQDPVTLYVTPEVQLNPLSYGWDAYTEYKKGNGNYYQEAEQISILYAPEKTEIRVKNQTAFSRDYFEIRNTGKLLDEAGNLCQGICGQVQLKGKELKWSLTNDSSFGFADSVLLTPAGYYHSGPLVNGEQKEDCSDKLCAYTSLGTANLDHALSSYILDYKDSNLINRGEDFLFVGLVEGKQPDFWMYSGYEKKGRTFYVAPVTLQPDSEGWVDSNWAASCFEIPADFQPASAMHDVEDLLLSEVQTDVIYHLDQAFAEDTEYGGIGFYLPEDQEQTFTGTLELYNVSTEQYEALEWEKSGLIRNVEDYIRDGQLKVRFQKEDNLEDSFVYAPILRVLERRETHAESIQSDKA